MLTNRPEKKVAVDHVDSKHLYVGIRRLLPIVVGVLFLHVFQAQAEGPQAPLAQPGFLGHSSGHAGFLGFRSSSYLGEHGIWGALLLTTEQGEALKQAFAETWVRRNEDPSLDGETKKELEKEFNRRRAEILTEQQRMIISDINRIYAELEEQQKTEGWSKIEVPLEAIKAIIPAENYANLELTLGQKP